MVRYGTQNTMTQDASNPIPPSDEAADTIGAEQRLQELEAKYAEMSDAYLRAKAESENTRRRADERPRERVLAGRGRQPCADLVRSVVVLAVVLGELGLVIEGIDVARRAIHTEEDDVLGPGREVRRLRGQRVLLFLFLLRRLSGESAEGKVAEAAGSGLEGVASGEHNRSRLIHVQKQLNAETAENAEETFINFFSAASAFSALKRF